MTDMIILVIAVMGAVINLTALLLAIRLVLRSMVQPG